MKRTFEILNEPELVINILTSFRKDNHLAKTFDGTIKNGVLYGFYTNLALINDAVTGYVKIKGLYDRDKGDLKLEIVPSNLYWIVIVFALAVMTFLGYKGFAESQLFFIGFILFLFIALGWTIAFILESKSFIKHINRVANLTVK